MSQTHSAFGLRENASATAGILDQVCRDPCKYAAYLSSLQNPSTYPVRLADIIATGVEPQVRIAVLLAVALAVVEDALDHVRDGAVVASTVAGGQHHDVVVARNACVAVPVSIFWHFPIPFRLLLEVARLRGIVLWCHILL